jgi:hypothetical protein
MYWSFLPLLLSKITLRFLVFKKRDVLVYNMNQEPQILDFRNIDFNKLEYHDPLRTKGGSYITNINYSMDDNTSVPIYIQTPRLKVVNGIIKRTRKANIELELDSSDSTNFEFYNFLTKFDETNLVTCHRRSSTWFGRQFPLDDIDKSYDGPIKSNRNRSPSINLNLQTVRSNIVTEIYNDQRKSTNADYVEPGDYVVAIIEIDGLKFGTTRFVFDMSVSQIKVFKEEVKGKLTGYHIQDEPTIGFMPGQDEENQYLSDVEDDEHRNTPNINESLDAEYTNDNQVYETGSIPLNQDIPVDDIQVINNDGQTVTAEDEPLFEDTIQQSELDDNKNDNQYDNHNDNQNDNQNDIKEFRTDNVEVDVNYTTEDVQKLSHNDFVSDAKTREYFEDLDELNTINFGINDEQYKYQIHEIRDGVRQLMNDYEAYKDECQHQLNDYRTKIDSTTEQYRELCHRYNEQPEY